ncbi:hypothetical protein F0562_026918 [Nyssa sinensis]|uniref:Uncharacterized protein n=1 Tax=Nyssa sinensis TaxID=561372 RepID=A0A5J5B277_9ASTE|nr:hypothetical protein F0562_026918 [Nyssa sinensis]
MFGIWMHADQSRTGFLGRAEFYNALKLVTVAQSKRELTPDIVKVALYGPASARIPAPQINLAPTPTPQLNSMSAASSPHMGAVAPTPQNLGFRGQVPPNASINQQYFPSQGNQSARPPLPMPAGIASRPPQGIGGSDFPRGGSLMGHGLPNSNISSDWQGGRTSGAPTAATSLVPNRGISQSMPSVAPKPQDILSMSPLTAAKDSEASAGSGNGIASDPIFGGGVFSATPSLPKHGSSTPMYSPSSAPASSATLPVSTGPQSLVKPDPLESLQSTFTRQPTGGQLHQSQTQTQTQLKPNQQVPSQKTSSLTSSGFSVEVGNSTSNQPQLPWPKMMPAGVQKYMKVFVEVDTDRDGKITGEEARNLFLSWRLPREVLKQVWDLADQDNDSMLSLREFCIALYLMERYREGCPLPPTLPSNILLDETLLSLTGQPSASYGNAAWGPTAGLRPQQGMSGSQPITSAAGLRPPRPVMFPQADRAMQFDQQKTGVTSMENSHVNQLSNGEQNLLNSKSQEAAETEKKVEDREKVILDSKEKIEFYRTKMQDLVLYKSRCDNRLNEITERAIADKREAESLTKKYEEKYKQVAEIASKLTIEEATFRDVQERKMELNQAIIKIEQGGSADGILQVRADRIQSDLEELMRALTERCKKHGMHVKSTALIELPIGWQPGIPEIAGVWDKDWDKFEDEGTTSFVLDIKFAISFLYFIFYSAKNAVSYTAVVKLQLRELKGRFVICIFYSYTYNDTLILFPGFSFDVMSSKTNSTSFQRENSSPNDSLSPDSLSHADGKSKKLFSKGECALESESAYTHSEDESLKSGCPVKQTAFESPSQEYSDKPLRKSSEADTETYRSFNEPSWGTFYNNDDTDSVWDINPFSAGDSDRGEKYFFGSSEFGTSPLTDRIPPG